MDTPEKKLNNYTQRALTGIVFVCCLIGAIVFNPYTFWGLFGSITLLAIWEFYSLAEKDNTQPQKIVGTFIAGLLFVLTASIAVGVVSVYVIATIIPLLFSLFIFELYTKSKRPFTNISYTILGIFYVALPFSLLNFLIFRNGLGYSPHIVLGYFFILWSCDTGAYLIGKSFGKHKLFSRISPKKSWEGTIGGTFIGLVTGYILSKYYTDLTLINWLTIAIIIAVIGAFGDLAESLFKRSIDIKDSGTILPGHGGLLDRFDSLLLSVPFIWAYLMLISHLKL